MFLVAMIKKTQQLIANIHPPSNFFQKIIPTKSSYNLFPVADTINLFITILMKIHF
jgi:hypothetical protein